MANEAMRKHVYFKNGRVRKAIDESENYSDFIEKCILYYLDAVEKGYTTKEELEEYKSEVGKNMEIMNGNYEYTKKLLISMAKYLEII